MTYQYEDGKRVSSVSMEKLCLAVAHCHDHATGDIASYMGVNTPIVRRALVKAEAAGFVKRRWVNHRLISLWSIVEDET